MSQGQTHSLLLGLSHNSGIPLLSMFFLIKKIIPQPIVVLLSWVLQFIARYHISNVNLRFILNFRIPGHKAALFQRCFTFNPCYRIPPTLSKKHRDLFLNKHKLYERLIICCKTWHRVNCHFNKQILKQYAINYSVAPLS